jgi:hypothetical protein
MDEILPMILPKGIVVNTKDIYKEVANFPVLPNDKLWEYWRGKFNTIRPCLGNLPLTIAFQVYTTTSKSLLDPTACRLEHFWWHVWGSDRRYLSGRALARLFEDISLGPTFVPLRGPPNRWEGPDVSHRGSSVSCELRELTASKNTALDQHDDPSAKDIDATKKNPADGTDENPETKSIPSKSSSERKQSSSKPRPAPILKKKPRGPSTSGPRPTARFVSPHESGDEVAAARETPSSGSTITPELELRAAVKSPSKKKSHGSGKKFVASTAGVKRRPVLSRKMSSQTSVHSSASDTKSSEGASSAGARQPGISQRSVSPIAEIATKPTVFHSSVIESGVSADSPVLSAKAAGKRPATLRSTGTATNLDQRQYQSPITGEISLLSTSRRQSDSMPRAQSSINLSTRSSTHNHLWPDSLRTTGTAAATQPAVGSVPISHSQHQHNHQSRGERRPSRGFSQGLFTGATASTTNVAAQGTIIDQSGSFGAMDTTNFFSRSAEHDSSLSSSLLESRFLPTQPSTAASVPLARTKSQLTLLLEREKNGPGDANRRRH